jgi:hypothetical protein
MLATLHLVNSQVEFLFHKKPTRNSDPAESASDTIRHTVLIAREACCPNQNRLRHSSYLFSVIATVKRDYDVPPVVSILLRAGQWITPLSAGY